jgi:ribosome-binding protein aMBF1 (putative translation factor)
MKCPTCGRDHAGHERTPGAFSAVCERCFSAEADQVNQPHPKKTPKPEHVRTSRREVKS